MSKGAEKVREAVSILKELGLPKEQQNERSALCLLALLNLAPRKAWAAAEGPLLGTTSIMTWAQQHYGKEYAPNTRETIRRHTLHQFCSSGIAVLNPDNPSRAVNSPKTVYQIGSSALELLRSFGSSKWDRNLGKYLSGQEALVDRYAQARKHLRIPVKIARGKDFKLSPGAHSKLIKDIIEQFAPRFAPGSVLVYTGDTGDKEVYLDKGQLDELHVKLDMHGKMPDVVLHLKQKNWLLLVEAVTSHGPVDGKRLAELAELFAGSSADIVYVTAFPDRATMGRHLGNIAWETEVWVADAPAHLIHFNGDSFLGPYTAYEVDT